MVLRHRTALEYALILFFQNKENYRKIKEKNVRAGLCFEKQRPTSSLAEKNGCSRRCQEILLQFCKNLVYLLKSLRVFKRAGVT